MLKSVSGLAGGLPRPATPAVSLISGYVGICVSDEFQGIGDLQRVVELYELLRSPLTAYLASLGLNQDEVEDVIQETFLRLVRHLARHGPERNLRGWVFRVARNMSVDLYRFEKRWRCDMEAGLVLHVDPAPNPEEKVLLDERRRKFEGACAQLTPRQRHCVLLRTQGLRYREIAVILGVSVQRVGELMQRAISSLEAGG